MLGPVTGSNRFETAGIPPRATPNSKNAAQMLGTEPKIETVAAPTSVKTAQNISEKLEILTVVENCTECG